MKKLSALSVASGLLGLAVLAGCSNGPAPGGQAGTPPASPNKAPASPAVAVVSPTPSGAPASPAASGTPAASGSPAASGTPVAADGGDDISKAAGQEGCDDVKKIGKNPLAADKGAADKGKTLFATNCASCHGAEGNGDGPAGMALDPKPRNLHAIAEYKFGVGDLALFRTIKYGVAGSGMAPWNGRMTDDECWQVVNFVKTYQK